MAHQKASESPHDIIIQKSVKSEGSALGFGAHEPHILQSAESTQDIVYGHNNTQKRASPKRNTRHMTKRYTINGQVHYSKIKRNFSYDEMYKSLVKDLPPPSFEENLIENNRNKTCMYIYISPFFTNSTIGTHSPPYWLVNHDVTCSQLGRRVTTGLKGKNAMLRPRSLSSTNLHQRRLCESRFQHILTNNNKQ